MFKISPIFLSTFCLLFLITFFNTVHSYHYTYEKYQEGALLSGNRTPFSIPIPIHVGLIGFNNNSFPPVQIDTAAMIRSLKKVLDSYIPRNLDHGKYLNIQFTYAYDIFHVDDETRDHLEGVLSASIRPTKDSLGRPVVTSNPHKINIDTQAYPLTEEEGKFLDGLKVVSPGMMDPTGAATSSPLYELNVGEIEGQLTEILLKSLSDHMKLSKTDVTSSKGEDNPRNPNAIPLQTKKGPDKEYSIFIFNPRRQSVMENSQFKPQPAPDSKSKSTFHDYIYGYSTRGMEDVLKARMQGLGGHFGSYTYTNTWVGTGRMIFADVQAVSSVGTQLDKQEAFLEEVLSNLYKTMSSGGLTNTIQQNNGLVGSMNDGKDNHGESFSGNVQSTASLGTQIDIYRTGLLSKRFEQQKAQTDDLTLYFTGQQEGRIISTSRANTLLPSLFDTSSLTTIVANPSHMSTMQQFGYSTGSNAREKQRLHQAKLKKQNDQQLRTQLSTQITPLLSSYISAAIKQIITTDITLPHQLLPLPQPVPSGYHSNRLVRDKSGKTVTQPNLPSPQPLQASILSIPVLVLTDHSYELNVADMIDIPIIEKLVAKLSLATTIKVIPVIHNVHTFPSISTTLFGSLSTVSLNPTPGIFGYSFHNVLNGDSVTQSIFKASLTNPILASLMPNRSQQSSNIIQSLMDYLGESFRGEDEELFDLTLSNSEIGSARNYFKQRSEASNISTDPKDNQSNRAILAAARRGRLRKSAPQTQVVPVVLFSLVSIPQDTTIIYPETSSLSATQASNGASSHQKPLILHLHQVHKTNLPGISEDGRLMLKKELTLQVISSLLQKITGTVPPHLRYSFTPKVPLPGLVPPENISPGQSSIQLSTSTMIRSFGGANAFSTTSAVTSIMNTHKDLTLGFTTQHKKRTSGGFASYSEQANNDNALGRSLYEYIDSTWTVGMHPFGPYATMYKTTKIYRDASRRNLVAVAVSELLQQLWGTISNTCQFVSSYGFLPAHNPPEGFIIDPLGNLVPATPTTLKDTIGNLTNTNSNLPQTSTDVYNDIVRFMVENDWVKDKYDKSNNCFQPFIPVPHFRPQTQDPDTQRLLEKLTEVNESEGERVRTALMLYNLRQKQIQDFLDAEGISYDDRMVNYLSIHSNAPIYVIQQMIRIADSIGKAETLLFSLQTTMSTNMDMTQSSSTHDNYGDYWRSVFSQLYQFANRVSMLGELTTGVREDIKQTYAACRVIQRYIGGEYSSFGYGTYESGATTEIDRQRAVNRGRYQLDEEGKNGIDRSNLKITSAISQSSIKTSSTMSSTGISDMILLCLGLTLLILVVLVVFVIVCADCFGGISPGELFSVQDEKAKLAKRNMELNPDNLDNRKHTKNYREYQKQGLLGTNKPRYIEDDVTDETPSYGYGHHNINNNNNNNQNIPQTDFSNVASIIQNSLIPTPPAQNIQLPQPQYQQRGSSSSSSTYNDVSSIGTGSGPGSGASHINAPEWSNSDAESDIDDNSTVKSQSTTGLSPGFIVPTKPPNFEPFRPFSTTNTDNSAGLPPPSQLHGSNSTGSTTGSNTAGLMSPMSQNFTFSPSHSITQPIATPQQSQFAPLPQATTPLAPFSQFSPNKFNTAFSPPSSIQQNPLQSAQSQIQPQQFVPFKPFRSTSLPSPLPASLPTSLPTPNLPAALKPFTPISPSSSSSHIITGPPPPLAQNNSPFQQHSSLNSPPTVSHSSGGSVNSINQAGSAGNSPTGPQQSGGLPSGLPTFQPKLSPFTPIGTPGQSMTYPQQFNAQNQPKNQ
jgi:hypothetical protein